MLLMALTLGINVVLPGIDANSAADTAHQTPPAQPAQSAQPAQVAHVTQVN